MINPLPKRFHNDSYRPHVLVRKKYEKPENIHACSHDVIRSNKENHMLIKRSAEPKFSEEIYVQTRFKRTSNVENPVFIETAVFVDKDLFDHMKSNYPLDTERELIRFVLAMINAVSKYNSITRFF